MRKQTVTNSRSGFSLVEIIVFVSVLSIALVSFIASVNYSSLLLNDARYKLVATRYTEELAEWLTFQRDYYGYTTLLAKVPSGTATYCLNAADITWPVISGDCGTSFTLGNFYQRDLVLTVSGEEITATLTTRWRYLSFNKSVRVVRTFNNYGL